MKKYEEEFVKSTERNRVSFISTLVLSEMLESGKITKDEVITLIKKNAEEQKHPERADDLIKFFEKIDVKNYIAQFGWRIFDLKKFHEERKRCHEEIRAKNIAMAEEQIRLAREAKAAQKEKNKQRNQPKKVELSPAPKKRIIVVKKRDS